MRPSAFPSAAPSRPPTLAPGPAGLTPVFRNGPRTPDKVVALTFDADMTADQGPRAAKGEHFDHPALIATLRGLKVPSTVFMTGRWAEEYPDQARSIGAGPAVRGRQPLVQPLRVHVPLLRAADRRGDRSGRRGRCRRAFREVGGGGQGRAVLPLPRRLLRHDALKALTPTGVTAVQWDVVGGDAFATDAAAVAGQVLDGVHAGVGGRPALHPQRGPVDRGGRYVRIVPELRDAATASSRSPTCSRPRANEADPAGGQTPSRAGGMTTDSNACRPVDATRPPRPTGLRTPSACSARNPPSTRSRTGASPCAPSANGRRHSAQPAPGEADQPGRVISPGGW